MTGPATGALGFDDLAAADYKAGFRGQSLTWMVAIQMRESGGNPNAYNPNIHTGDQSWGLSQINTLGANGPGIRKILQGLGYSGDFHDLMNPLVNAQVAFKLSNAGTNFEPWRSNSPGWDGPQGWLTNATQYIPAATTASLHAQMGTASNVNFLTSAKTSQANAGTAYTKMTSWLSQQVGKPYQAGTVGPNAFDCSGLVTALYQQLGVDLPPLTFSQVKYGLPVSTDQLQPGDLVFFHGAQGDLGHVGVYIGNGQYEQAPHTGAFVQISTLDPSKVQAARRIVDSSGKVITGAGLTPQNTVGTVPVSGANYGTPLDSTTAMASLFGNQNTQTVQPTTDQSQTAQGFTLPTHDYTLPGFGKGALTPI